MFWQRKKKIFYPPPSPGDPLGLPIGLSEKDYKRGRLEALSILVELPIVLMQKEFDRIFPVTSKDRKPMRRHLAIELLRMILGLRVGRRIQNDYPDIVARAWKRYQCKGPIRISCCDPPINNYGERKIAGKLTPNSAASVSESAGVSC